MFSSAPTPCKILRGEGNADEYGELLQNLKESRDLSKWWGHEMQRQQLRLHDLRDGDELGFIVELFFLAFEQLLSTSSSKESHSALYKGTFRTITSDWSKHKHSPGTQTLLEIAWSHCEEFSGGDYPTYIIEEFFSLLDNIFEGQRGPHIEEAVQAFESFQGSSAEMKFRDRMLKIVARVPAQSS